MYGKTGTIFQKYTWDINEEWLFLSRLPMKDITITRKSLIWIFTLQKKRSFFYTISKYMKLGYKFFLACFTLEHIIALLLLGNHLDCRLTILLLTIVIF